MNVVVVGVSPSSGSPSALRFAAEEARLRNVPLRAVMAWRPPRPPAAPGGRPPAASGETAAESEAAAERSLREFVHSALGDGADIDCAIVRGNAVNALVTAAHESALLVVGEPRNGTINRVRSSLVAPQVVLKSRCPVVVMPTAAASAG